MHFQNKIIGCDFEDISLESTCQLLSGSYWSTTSINLGALMLYFIQTENVSNVTNKHLLVCRKFLLVQLYTRWTFKLTDFTFLKDIKDEIHLLIPYRDNRKIVKLEYRSSSIDNGGKIEFNKFEIKMQVDVRDMYFHFEEKIMLELEAIVSISVEDIAKMLKCPPGYWSVILYFMLKSSM